MTITQSELRRMQDAERVLDAVTEALEWRLDVMQRARALVAIEIELAEVVRRLLREADEWRE